MMYKMSTDRQRYLLKGELASYDKDDGDDWCFTATFVYTVD